MSGAAVFGGLVLLGLGTLAMKAVGPVLAGGGRRPPEVLGRVGVVLPTALLSALVATDLLATGVDARLAGTALAAVAVVLRAPFLVVVLAGTASTALLRAVGVA
jgi:uncharacterized membrane protein